MQITAIVYESFGFYFIDSKPRYKVSIIILLHFSQVKAYCHLKYTALSFTYNFLTKALSTTLRELNPKFFSREHLNQPKKN